MASGRFLHHGLLQVHGMEKSSSIPACTRGGLGGCRGRGEQRTPQGHKASREVSAPQGWRSPAF